MHRRSCPASPKKSGLNINIKTTEVMRINNKKQDLYEVEKFVYLGSVVSKDGGTDEDVKSRINKTRHAFNTLRPIWNSSALSLHNKIRIFNTNVKCILLYGSETWRTMKSNIHTLQTFINRCLRNTINIRWPDVISNTDFWDKTGQSPIEVEIRVDRPHTQEVPLKGHQASPCWNPQGKRKVGRPEQTWRRSTDAEVKAIGMTAEEDLTEPSALEECCCGPMFLREPRGLSKQVSIFTTTSSVLFS